MNNTRIFKSSTLSIDDLVLDLRQQLNGMSPALFLFFAGTVYEPSAVTAAVKSILPHTIVAGCTTAGEITNEGMTENSFVGIALSSDVTGDISCVEIKGEGSSSDVREALQKLAADLKQPAREWDPSQYLGIVLFDAMSRTEEKLMDILGDMTDVPFVGGSAGDDLAFSKTSLYLEGTIATGPAIMLLMRPKVKFDIIKTQSVKVLPKVFTVTKANEAERIVLEFDGVPAAQAYADALNIEINDIDTKFITNPLGLVVGNDVFVRSILKTDGDALAFYCSMVEGMKVNLLETTDIVEETRQVIAQSENTDGPISAMVMFNCIIRTLELRSQDKTAQYSATFGHIPTVGFSTYGEAYLGHINQTATIVAFRGL